MTDEMKTVNVSALGLDHYDITGGITCGVTKRSDLEKLVAFSIQYLESEDRPAPAEVLVPAQAG